MGPNSCPLLVLAVSMLGLARVQTNFRRAMGRSLGWGWGWGPGWGWG